MSSAMLVSCNMSSVSGEINPTVVYNAPESAPDFKAASKSHSGIAV